MRKFVSLLLLMGAFGYGLAQPLAIDTAWFRHVPSAHHLTYWFDNNSASAQELSLTQTSLQMDVSFLPLGVHTIHCYAVDSAGVVYPTTSAMFFCPPSVGSDSTAAQQVVYWFDQDFDNRHVSSLHSGPQLIDVSTLAMGVHTLHSYVVGIDNTVYPTSSAMFFCPPTIGTDSTAAQQVVYWFDQDFDNRHVSSLHSGPQLIDVSALAMGVHTLHSYVVGIDNTVYPTSSAMFFCPPSVGSDSTVAQQVVYWFDQDFDGRHFASLQSGPQLLDVSDLDIGVHTIHSYVVGADNKAYPTTSVMFFRLPYIDSDSAEAQEVVYWFDQDYANRHIAPLQAGTQMLDVTMLSVGVHTLHSYVVGTDNTVYPTSSAMFFRPPAIGADSTAAQELVYWFDQDYNNRHIAPLQAGVQMLDVSSLPMGVHTIHSYVVGTDNTVYPTSSAMFFRPPAIGTDSTAAQEVVYWFDQDYAGRQRTTLLSMSQTLDVSNLSTGVHTLHCYVMGVDGVSYPTTSSMFFRPPGAGSESMDGITQYYYWFNNDITNATRVHVNPVTNPLQWYGLIPIEPIPFRSTYFHFELDTAQQPHAYAKNTFHTLFMDDMGKFVIGDAAPFVDYHVSQPVVADTIERGATKIITVPTNNNIHWFKLGVGVGDSLSFTTNKRCTMQLYAPNGEMVFRSSGDSVLSWVGCHAWEDGVYYLAVHDGEGTGNMTVSYQWVYRYAVLAWDVHRVGNGGISTITFEGNGFDNLDTVYLVKGLDTIPAYALHHERNTAIEIRFDFLGTDTGIYDALFIFSESGIYKMNVVEVDNAVPIYLTSNVSYPSTFLRGGSVMYSFEITNMGNMTAYNVPVYFYIGMPINDGISWAKFSGVNLVDYYDLMKDLYDWTDEERENLKQYSEEVGDLHYFVQSTGLDDRLDGINILSANFFLNIPPDSTRTITLELKSNNYVDVWMSSPDNWKADTRSEDRSPTNRFDNRPLMANRSDFCCWHDDLEDIANNISVTLAVFSFGTQAVAAVTLGAAAVTALTPLWPLAGAISAEAAQIEALSLAAGITSCMMGGIANISAEIAASLCNDHISGRERFVSWGGLAIGCVSNFLPTKPIFKGPTVLQTIATGTSATTSIVSEAYNSRNPECTDNPPKGGKSQPYVPVDPNEIVGYIAESGSTYIPDSVQTVDYFIECENDPVMAQAAAHKVVIVDTLSSQLFDLSTFRPSQVTIGNNSIFLDGAQNGVYTMDLRPQINALAQVSVSYTPTTGVARWTIEALNPITLTPTLDVNEGVLPPNTDGSGIARVYYSIGLLNTLGDGDPVSNRAYITFDFEDAIATPVWTNIIDAISPTSRIAYGNIEGDTLSLSFQATDNRSGVWRYDVFGRSDSLDSWHLVNTGKTSVQRLAVDSLLTDFYVVAIDSAGNRENKTPQVEYNTTRGVVGPSVTTYQIQFVNFDNTVLCSYRLPMGATPAYLGSTPSRNADAHYSYRFRGWTPAIAPVAGNAVYHAVYDSIPNSYHICFFDYDSTLLQSDSLPYGAMPSYYSSIPTRPEVDSFVYAFVGWTPELMPVSGNADYRPVFDSMLYYQLPRYLVTFRNWNDSVLQSDSVTFGTIPHYWGIEPTREGNAYCDYRFRGWTPRLAPVTESVVYTAEFDTLVHSYPVTFVNFNGVVLQQDTLPYGSMPVYRGNTPARRTTIQYTYTFVGWSPNIDTVRGVAVYTAVFDSVFSCISQYHYDNISTCDSVLWRGNVYATSGTYSERVEGVAYGCDSVYVLNLTIKNKSYVTDVQTACDSYTWHGTTYTASTNTPTFTEQNVDGCDSVVTLHLTINHSNTGTDVQTACDSYTWHGTTHTASTNTPTYTEQNVDGCDSVVTLHLTINHSNTGTDVQTACDSYTWHGTTYTASTNTPTFTGQNVEGCDSVATLHLTINHSNTGTDEQTACDSYTWHGTTYTASTNTPTFTEQNMEGCDSVVTLHLTINHSSTGTDVQTACDTYTWHGTTYTASTNTPTFTEQNMEGCDSVVTLHLTVNHSDSIVFTTTACDSLLWHGTVYTSSTETPVFVTQNSMGCDSIVTLHLTINNSTTNVFDLADCDSVVWSDMTFYTSTDTNVVQTNSVGCDSLIILHLSVNYSARTTVTDSAQGSYDWNGQTYTESGEYTFTTQTEAGCDSIVTLILTITQTEGILFDGFEQVTLYPNPTTGKIVINGMKVVRVEVYDLDGRLVDTFMNTNSFDISQLSGGTYLVRITLPQGETVRRVIKH